MESGFPLTSGAIPCIRPSEACASFLLSRTHHLLKKERKKEKKSLPSSQNQKKKRKKSPSANEVKKDRHWPWPLPSGPPEQQWVDSRLYGTRDVISPSAASPAVSAAPENWCWWIQRQSLPTCHYNACVWSVCVHVCVCVCGGGGGRRDTRLHAVTCMHVLLCLQCMCMCVCMCVCMYSEC